MATDLQVGDKVGYACVPSLMNYKGKIVFIGRTPRGGDCKVEWWSPTIVTTEECLFNLRKLTN